jgi:hypothetical protein
VKISKPTEISKSESLSDEVAIMVHEVKEIGSGETSKV